VNSIIIVIGASGIIAQITLIRELLVNFQGNELSLGLILGNWLIAEALGSFLFRKLKITSKSYQLIILLFALLFPLLVILTQLLRPILGVLPGEIITLPMMFVSSLVILLPVSFLHGALFTSTASVLISKPPPIIIHKKVAGNIYTIENIGTVIGGLIIYFFLIPYLNSLQIASIVALINSLAIIILFHEQKKLNILYCLSIILFAVLFIFSSPVEHWDLSKNYPKYKVLASTNTIYNNLTVTEREEQYTFLLDGVPTIITPYPDQSFIEDFVHFPMLAHPYPKKILLISNGVGGVLNQMLKYPLQEIDYLELDPNLIKTVEKYPTPLTMQELSDPRVKVINTDARLYIEKDTAKYDIIFVSFLSPLSLQVNRFFSEEFYRLCQRRLNNNGIMTTLSPGSLTYISSSMRNLINSNINTLEHVFPQVIIIPGDFNIYLSSALSNFFDPDTLSNRLLRRDIKTSLFNRQYIQYRTQKYNSDWLQQSLIIKSGNHISLINQDGNPRGLFYSLNYWNTITNPSLNKLFVLLNKITPQIIYIILFAGLILLLLVKKRSRNLVYVPFAIFTTGITAMVFTLILSIGFQIRYGYLFYQISILITMFIIGNAVGGYFGNSKMFDHTKYLLINELSLIVLLIIILATLKNHAYPMLFGTRFDFFILLVISGFLVGVEFPIANRIYLNQNMQITQTVGKLYAVDLIGGFIGAITISVILIPVLGIFQTLIIALLLKIISALLVLTVTSFSIE
jgi:spermidine synthase